MTEMQNALKNIENLELKIDDKHDGKNTYNIISTAAYLLGVGKNIFENPHEPPQMEFYEKLDKIKSARIIRNLSRIRTSAELNFKKISQQMSFECKSIYTIPQIPGDAIKQLSDDGIEIYHSKYTLAQYIVLINRLISERINNCRDLFPDWLNWQYMRDIFIMPNGLSESGTKEASTVYYNGLDNYPYQVYLHWQPTDSGNILYNDKKFVSLLYSWNGDEFTEFSRVSDIGDAAKGNIYTFIKQSGKTAMVVDCENSDPYKLCAVLRGLDKSMLDKIKKIILYDDVNTVPAWNLIERYTSIPVEHIVVHRIKEQKSLVDVQLTGGVMREYYTDDVDSFIILSSDSDYWGLISSLPEADFLVMIEHSKCGEDLKKALAESDIYFCYIDDFYSGDFDIRSKAVVSELQNIIDESVSLNINDALNNALRLTRVGMEDEELKQFKKKYLQQMKLITDDEGNVRIELKS